MEIATKDITVSGEVFPCPKDWTVDQAKEEIRSAYGLQFGYLQAGGVPLLGTQRIRNTAGALSFAGGQSTLQGKTVTKDLVIYLI